MSGRKLIPSGKKITMMNGDSTVCAFECRCTIDIFDSTLTLKCFVCNVVPGFDALLGMDVVSLLGGVAVSGDGKTMRLLAKESLCAAAAEEEVELTISDKDFTAEFSGGKWKVAWKWAEGSESPKLANWVSQYAMEGSVEKAFTEEIKEWIDRGWLRPYDGEHDGIIPLMAVVI